MANFISMLGEEILDLLAATPVAVRLEGLLYIVLVAAGGVVLYLAYELLALEFSNFQWVLLLWAVVGLGPPGIAVFAVTAPVKARRLREFLVGLAAIVSVALFIVIAVLLVISAAFSALRGG